jgi:hypothetical protein
MVAVKSSLSTYAQIEKKVRRLTASSSNSTLTSDDIGEYVNCYYMNDFAYGIKMDQMRNVYTFFTEPYRDRYPLDVNYNQGIRAPVYFEGIQGSFYKDRQQFYSVWPRFPTQLNPISGDGNTTSFTFTIPAPFLSKEVVLGGVDANGDPISVNDDGAGNLQLQVPNPVITTPPYTDVYTALNAPNSSLVGKPIPGMHNQNTLNPGLNQINTQTTPFTNAIGSVNYITGVFSINFPVAPAAGTQITLWVSQYQTGRPACLLFWNNEFTIRPVPQLVHKVEVETYLTPVQFMESTDSPIINQWWQLIAIGAAIKVLEDRGDMEGVENLVILYDRQEALCLERQANEEIFQPNITMFNSSTPVVGGANGIGYYGGI